MLGGGGARGIAHVSVLRRLEELHVPIDCIAGTSMGSLVGGLYAAGRSADEIEHLVRSTDWPGMFDDNVERPERAFQHLGFAGGRRLGTPAPNPFGMTAQDRTPVDPGNAVITSLRAPAPRRRPSSVHLRGLSPRPYFD